MTLRNVFIALAVVAATAVPAFAEEPADDRMVGAWEDAIGDQEPILTDKQFAALNNLAFQAAVTKVCDGYQIDQAKFSQGFADATGEAPAGLTPEETGHWHAAVLFRFGATYGLFLAEGNADATGFCASAAELKAESETPKFWQ